MYAKRATKINKLFRTLAGLVAMHGLFAFMGHILPEVKAASSQNITFTVVPLDPYKPVAITDLSVMQTMTDDQLLLSWTAPDEDNAYAQGLSVQSYEVRYATYSIDTLAGDTTAWWNAATVAPNPPSVPQAPGNVEMMVVNNLPLGIRHWFAVKSVDERPNTSDIDTLASTPGAQANGITRDPSPPAPVAGMTAVTNPDSSFSVDWSEVVLNEDGTPTSDIAGYRVYSSTSIMGPFSTVVSTSPSANVTGTVLTASAATDEYFLIVAVDQSGNESNPGNSNFLHVTPQGILGQVGMASDSSFSRAYVPQSLMTELESADDLLIRVSRNSDPVLNADVRRTLRTYTVEFSSPTSTAPDANFVLSRPEMRVVVQYDDMASTVQHGELGVLWWNGTKWLKMGQAEFDAILKTASFETALPGNYQVRRFQPATELTLDKSSVFPRIFSPNGDGINDKVFFVLENPNGALIEGKVFDLSGGYVANLQPGGAGAPTPDTLIWNGKDKQGNVVPAGVYVYQVKGDGQLINGTVVVAK